MTISPEPHINSSTAASTRGLRIRRLASALAASAAVAVGGGAALPSGTAQAAGITQGSVQHLAVIPESSTTEVAPGGYGLTGLRPTLRLRVTPDGNVVDA